MSVITMAVKHDNASFDMIVSTTIIFTQDVIDLCFNKSIDRLNNSALISSNTCLHLFIDSNAFKTSLKFHIITFIWVIWFLKYQCLRS